MSHGERWIVPLNLLIIIAFCLVWATSLPLWTTFLIALPIALVLACFGIDKYGGMQIVMLAGPACLIATIGISKKYRHAVDTNSELNIGQLVFQFAGTVVGGAVVLSAVLAAFVGVAICLEWSMKKIGVQQVPKTVEPSDIRKSPVNHDLES